MLHAKVIPKPHLVIVQPNTTTVNCQRFKQSPPTNVKRKINLLNLDTQILIRLDTFLTSYQAYCLLISSRKLDFLTVSDARVQHIESTRIEIADQQWDDNRNFFLVSRALSLTTKFSHILPMMSKSRCKKFCPRKLTIADSHLPWNCVRDIAMNAHEFILDNSTVTGFPRLNQFLNSFDNGRVLVLPNQTLEKLWLNDLVNWKTKHAIHNFEFVVSGIDFNFNIEKLYRFFKNRTRCIVRVKVMLPNYTRLRRVRHEIDNNLSAKFLQVKYNQIPLHYFKLTLQAGHVEEELEYIPRT